MAVVLIFNHVYWFSQKNTLGKLVTMATRKRLFLIYKIENFANTQFWKVTKFQGASLFRCGVLSHLLGIGWKTPPPPVLIGLRHFLPNSTRLLTRDTNSRLETDSSLFSPEKLSILYSASKVCQGSHPSFVWEHRVTHKHSNILSLTGDDNVGWTLTLTHSTILF